MPGPYTACGRPCFNFFSHSVCAVVIIAGEGTLCWPASDLCLEPPLFNPAASHPYILYMNACSCQHYATQNKSTHLPEHVHSHSFNFVSVGYQSRRGQRLCRSKSEESLLKAQLGAGGWRHVLFRGLFSCSTLPPTG